MGRGGVDQTLIGRMVSKEQVRVCISRMVVEGWSQSVFVEWLLRRRSLSGLVGRFREK
jgi:hypothetical protein